MVEKGELCQTVLNCGCMWGNVSNYVGKRWNFNVYKMFGW